MVELEARGGNLRGVWIGLAVLISVLIPAVVAGQAKAASPILEFTSASPFPIPFTADGGQVTAAMTDFDAEVHCNASHGAGTITGPRSTVSTYAFTECETLGGAKGGQPCESAGAEPNEIKSGPIQANLVFIDQARREVGMLLNPFGGTYLDFECGGESVKALGSFLAPVGPVNQPATAFTASLGRLGTMQIPNEYEGASGERLKAIPTGEREGQPAAATGVSLSFTIHPSAPLAIKAITAAEIEAKQRAEEEAARKRHEEELAKGRRELEHKRLAKALKNCRTKIDSKHKRIRCENRAKRKHRV